MKTKPDTYQISKGIVVYKLVTGTIELVLGLSIFLFGNNFVKIYRQYQIKELVEEPHDQFIRIISSIIPFFIQHRIYIITVLLLIGITKIIGAVGLLRNKEWGLDLLIGLFVIMLPFDIYELFLHITLLKVSYFLINLFIALYLVEFKPHKHFKRWKRYILHFLRSR